jgi:hemolysin activation/secretion protein
MISASPISNPSILSIRRRESIQVTMDNYSNSSSRRGRAGASLGTNWQQHRSRWDKYAGAVLVASATKQQTQSFKTFAGHIKRM